MNSRERILNAVGLSSSASVPIDLGSTVFTTITATAYDRLKNYLKIDKPTKLSNFIFQTVDIDEEILERFKVDTRGVYGKGPVDWEDKFDRYGHHTDEWGVVRKMSSAGYLDIVHSPFSETFSSSAIKNYHWPNGKDRNRFPGLKSRVNYLREHTDYAIVLYIFGGITTLSMFLRGFENWLMDLYENVELINELLEQLVQYQIDSTETALDIVGGDVDIVAFADDFATQNNLMFSPDSYRQLVKPKQARLFNTVKSNSNAKILFHSCGAIRTILPDLIELGVDAINPVQVTAEGMDPNGLKADFGDKVCFWGGIDTQTVLSSGTPESVKNEVNRIISILGRNGGYVLNAVHNIQNEVPPENILSLFDTAISYRSK